MAGAGWWPTVPHCGRGRALASCQDSCCPQTALITHHRALNHPCRLHPSPLPANAKAHKAFVFLCPVAFRFPNGPCIYGRVFIAAVWRPSMAKEKPAICLHVFFGVTLFFCYNTWLLSCHRVHNTYSLCSWVPKRPSGQCIWCELISGVHV